MRIEGVELVPERGSYKVDASGRIIIPAYMRSKFEIEKGDLMEYFTAYVDGKWFLCATKDIEGSIAEQAKEAAKRKKKNGQSQ